MNPDELFRLYADGNRRLSEKLAEQYANKIPNFPSFWMKLRATHLVKRSILVPLIDRGNENSRLFSIRVRNDASSIAHENSITGQSVSQAITRAWFDLRGTGEHPQVGIEFPTWLPHIEGPSMFLGIYLAACAHFSGIEPLENIIATGHPEYPVDLLDKKRELYQNSAVSKAPFVFASNGNELGAISLQAARERVFRYFLLHESAPRHRVHIYSGELRKTHPWKTGEVLLLDAGPFIEKSQFVGLAQELFQKIQHHFKEGCVDVSIAGPQILAAAMGLLMRNHPQCIFRMVATPPQETAVRVLWDNRVQLQSSEPGVNTAGTMKVSLAPKEATLPEDWTRFEVPTSLNVQLLHELVEQFISKYRGVHVLHLAFGSWLPLAWIVAGMLKNKVSELYLYHFQNGEYVCWCKFSNGRLIEA